MILGLGFWMDQLRLSPCRLRLGSELTTQQGLGVGQSHRPRRQAAGADARGPCAHLCQALGSRRCWSRAWAAGAQRSRGSAWQVGLMGSDVVGEGRRPRGAVGVCKEFCFGRRRPFTRRFGFEACLLWTLRTILIGCSGQSGRLEMRVSQQAAFLLLFILTAQTVPFAMGASAWCFPSRS